ncbi:MAG: DNA polymerase III subunit gamma/tau [Clostridiales bacterium]|nr:DNA polymerase III subunit gamma/tau [Clostridiales bacterium]
MSYTALYRKWRPIQFGDVKGQDSIVQTLRNQMISQRIAHAYLFCGTRGTGKTSIAKIFARAVNCERPVDGSPCNECETCRGILAGRSMNVVEIDAASNNGVENIREIREQVQYPPTEGHYRVYIIDEVHMLSTGAFNALLKTLEEPPSYVIFILATTEANKIPVTVLSRCQRYDFKRLTVDTIAARLRELSDAEGILVEEKALRYLAKAADGAMRDALSLLDQCVAFHYGTLLTYDNVLDVLGAVDTSVFSRLLRAVIGDETTECMRILEDMVIQGRELGQFVNDFIWYLRNLLVLKTTDDVENMLEMSAENLSQLAEEAGMIDENTLMRYIRVFSELSGQLRYAVQKRVLIEVALIRLTRPQMEQNLDSILQRLTVLEEKVEKNADVSPDMLRQLAAQIGSGVEGGVQSGMTVADAGSAGLRQISIPKAELEDLNLIRQDWGKITRELGGAIRPAFRNTVLEPAGDSCLCIVFADEGNYQIGRTAERLGEIERYIEEQYGKELSLKARLAGNGERMDTVYVSDEDLSRNIQGVEIEIED